MQLKRKVGLVMGACRSLSRGIALSLAREGVAARYLASMAPQTQDLKAVEPPADGIAEATVITDPNLDLDTALKAAQTLSSEVTLDSLVETIMALVIEQ